MIGLVILGAIGVWVLWAKMTEPERRAQQESVLEQRRRIEANEHAREERERAERIEAGVRRKREQEERREAAMAEARTKEQERLARVAEQGAQRVREILATEADLLGKFLEVTLRKVTLRDEYGDENWGALDDEVERVIAKLQKKHPDAKPREPLPVPKGYPSREWQEKARKRSEEPNIYLELTKQLRERFKAHYDATAESRASPDVDDVAKLDGVAYEAQVMTWLQSLGVEDVRGTPRTGDQGADVIFTYQGRRVVVQCKRYRGSVGNGAVQEVHAAKSIYDCTDAWVITTGRATPGAREAAQRTGVVLIEGATSSQGIRDALASLSSSAPVGTPG